MIKLLKSSEWMVSHQLISRQGPRLYMVYLEVLSQML